MKQIIRGMAVALLLTNSLYAQQWEGDLSQVGKSHPGGFDYHLKKYTIEQVGTRKQMTFNYDGVRTFTHAPAPGIHPRIYFNPEERENIIDRLKNTEVGKETARLLRAHAALVNLPYGSGGYQKGKPYSQNKQGMEYISNPGMFNKYELYEQISAPDAPKGLLDRFIGDGKKEELRRMAAGLSCEAFECYLHEPEQKDTQAPYTVTNTLTYRQRAEKLARAMTYWADAFITCYKDQVPQKAINKYDQLGGMHMPVMYDINFWAMNENQKHVVRKAISMTVPQQPKYGMYCEPFTTTSNWATLNFFEIIPNLAIEGEPGYNAQATHNWVQVLYKFLNYGFYSDGSPWEGLGKNYMMTGQLNALARRGYSFLGHPHVRKFTSFYLSQIVQPFGFAFIGDDLYGGTDGGNGGNPQFGGYRFHSIDAIGLNYAYPDDAGCSFVWRNYVSNKTKDEKEFIDLTNGAFSPGTHNYFDRMAILVSYADDWHGNKDWTEHRKKALGNQLDYFADGRGIAIMRSDFSPNALSTQFNVRQNFGGHTSADRNDFTLSALGRIWVPREAAADVTEMDFFSCLLVNHKGMTVSPDEGVKSRQPVKVIDYQSNDKSCIAVGDATYAYNWDFRWKAGPLTDNHPLLIKNEGWEKANETLNDFMLTLVKDEPYFNKPFYEFGSWNATKPGDKERIVKRKVNNMDHVIRTIAICKGKHPFLIIVDDIAKENNEKADYTSYIQMATDLSLDKIQETPKKNGLYDVIIKDKDNRRLLIRVIGHNNYKDGNKIQSNFGELKDKDGNYFIKRGKEMKRQRIAFEACNVVSPDFKMLIFPLSHGDALPETIWNKNKTELSVKWENEMQTIRFVPDTNKKRTIVTVL